MKRLLLCCVLVAAVSPSFVFAQLFTPGNVIFADPFYTPDGQIVELKIDGNSASIVNVVRWPLDGADRRRALGLDVDPNGNVWVGLTATFGDTSEFPLGIGEILRITKDGTQTFWMTDIIKVTYLAALGPDEVMVNSNAADANLAQRFKVSGEDVIETVDYYKGGHGEALRLPDGRILMGDNVNPGIHIYNDAGGDPVGVFSEVPGADGVARTVRSMTYNDAIGAVIASLQNEKTIVRLSMNGDIEEEIDASTVGFTKIWGIAQIPDTTQFIIGSHDVADLANTFGVFDALNLAAAPRLIKIDSGFEQAGLAAGTSFRSFFNLAVVPGAALPGVEHWDLH
ncbi:MAG: hypothetical protein GC154_09520 [bacterium]|nr:hypothetical protein [bacterium]